VTSRRRAVGDLMFDVALVAAVSSSSVAAAESTPVGAVTVSFAGIHDMGPKKDL